MYINLKLNRVLNSIDDTDSGDDEEEVHFGTIARRPFPVYNACNKSVWTRVYRTTVIVPVTVLEVFIGLEIFHNIYYGRLSAVRTRIKS